MGNSSGVIPVETLQVSTYTVPTDAPESDGTLEWTRTTLVLVEVKSAGKCGLGYTYADTATASLIHTLANVVIQSNAMSPPATHSSMWHRIRNLGRPGICSMAISIMADGFGCCEQIAQETGRHALHLAEVIQMGLQQKGGTATDTYPESALAARRKSTRRKARLQALAALASIGAVTVGWAWMRRR